MFAQRVCHIRSSAIGGEEYDAAFLVLVRLAQWQAYPGLVEALEKYPAHEVFSKKAARASPESFPPITHYSPFVGNGVVRVGGRFEKANVTSDFSDF